MEGDNISTYRDYMREIKSRVDVVMRALASYDQGNSLTGYSESDIELSYLQIRKILELIMFSSISAHYHGGVQLQSRLFGNEWNATKIMNFLAKVNLNYFPMALSRLKLDSGESDTMVPVEGALTKLEFQTLYDRVCGNYLHAARKSQFEGKQPQLLEEIRDWIKKITLLLNSHWVHIDRDVVFAVLMQTSIDGDVQVAIFSEVPSAKL